MQPGERAVCVVLHDVAPETWPGCERLLCRIDALGGRIPVTLLVVPEYHRGGSIDTVPAFVRAVETRMARGDEVAMHGCFHWDDLSATTPLEWVRRRIYTRGEGEFAALGETAASARLARGIAVFDRLGWPVRGFVAPAWLLGDGARAALTRSSFTYTSTRRLMFSLPDWQPYGAPSLVWSVRSAARRRAFRLYNRWLLVRCGSSQLLRFGLHPVDAAFPEVVEFWMHALRESLATRMPMTKVEWLDSVREERPLGRSSPEPERIRTT